jgi:hypothetical protein
LPNCFRFCGERQRGLERALRQAEGEGADTDPAGVEGLHEVDEALPFFTQPVLGRDLHVLEDELARVGRAPAHLVFLLRRPDAAHERLELRRVADAHAVGLLPIGGLLGHDEAGDPLRAQLPIVTAVTTKISPTPAWVMKILLPLSR